MTEGTRPAAPGGYDWGTASYTGNPATITAGGNATVGITNPLAIIPAPGLAIEKGVSLTNGSGYGPSLTTSVGTTVYYRIHVSNTGNAALSGVTLVDSLFDLVAKGCTIPTTLAIGAGFDCDYSDVAKVGTTTNTATADSTETTSVNDSATVTVASAPGLAIEKGVSLTNGSGYGPSLTTSVGTTVYYRIHVSNTGNAALSGVTLVDNLFDLVAKGCTIPTTLAIGAGFDCDYSDVAKVGTTTNTATADSTETTSVNDSATVTVASAPGLAIEKTANPTSLPYGGGSVTYTYAVTNTGNTPLYDVELIDRITGSETIACSPISAPVKTGGNQDSVLDVVPEVWTYTCIKTITQTTNNTATVTAWTRGEDKLTASDSAVVTVGQQPPPQLGSLTITKVVNPAEDFRGGTFKFDVSCATQQTITLAAGEGSKSVTIFNLPLGTSCMVTEVTPLTAGPGWQWVGQPAYAPGQTVTIPATITVTNSWGEVAGATATPRVTPPPTTTVGGEDTANPGSNLGLALAAISLFGLVLGLLAPMPARARRRSR